MPGTPCGYIVSAESLVFDIPVHVHNMLSSGYGHHARSRGTAMCECADRDTFLAVRAELGAEPFLLYFFLRGRVSLSPPHYFPHSTQFHPFLSPRRSEIASHRAPSHPIVPHRITSHVCDWPLKMRRSGDPRLAANCATVRFGNSKFIH